MDFAGEIPRRHSSSSCVYIEKYLQLKHTYSGTVQSVYQKKKLKNKNNNSGATAREARAAEHRG